MSRRRQELSNLQGDMMKKEGLSVSEHFYSIQGEGIYAGTPAVFLRLTGCVLNCVWCDTTAVWTKGVIYSLDELKDIFRAAGYNDYLRRGARLIVTGGDPLLQQDKLQEFLREMNINFLTPVDIETEGCIYPTMELQLCVSHFNVSPKLASSGMPLNRRIRMDVLKMHASRQNDYWKFPIAGSEDYEEAKELVKELNLEPWRIFLMPVSDTRDGLVEASRNIVRMCMETGWRYSSRLQLLIWDRTTGV